MNFLESIITSTALEAFGLTLMHSLWQGAVIALLLAFALFVLRRSSSKSRYLLATSSLFLLFISTCVTFFLVYQSKQQAMLSAVDQDLTYTLLFLGNPETLAQAVEEQSLWSFIGELSLYIQSHAPLIVTAWIMGVLILTLRLIGGYTLAQRLKSYKTRPVSSYWNTKLEELIAKVGVQKSVKLVESGIAKVPMVIGHLKPVILVPAGVLSGLTPHQIEAILAHELAHIQRHDYLVNLIQSVLEIVLFYHPAIWWISACIREERENACDDVAIQVCGDSLVFARALTSLEQRTLGAPQLAMAFYGNKGSLINRVKRLIGKPNHRGSLPEGIVLLSLMLLTFFSFAFQVDDKELEAKESTTQYEYDYAQYTQHVDDSTKQAKKEGKVKADKKKDKDKQAAKDKKKDKNKVKEKAKSKTKVVIADDKRFPLLIDMDELGLDGNVPYVIDLENMHFPDVQITDIPATMSFPIFLDSLTLSDSSKALFAPQLTETIIRGQRNFHAFPDIESYQTIDDLAIFLDSNARMPLIINGNTHTFKALGKKSKGLFYTNDFSAPEPLLGYSFHYLDTSKVDSATIKEYKLAQEQYRKALEKLRMQRDSQRVELEKQRKVYLEKYRAEIEKYRATIEKQRAEMLAARAKELEKMRDLQREQVEKRREQVEEMRKQTEKMRAMVEKERVAQQTFWNDIRKQMVKDGLIDKADAPLKLRLDNEMMKVNGTAVSAKLHQKYKKLFAKKYGDANIQWKGNRDKVTIDLND